MLKNFLKLGKRLSKLEQVHILGGTQISTMILNPPPPEPAPALSEKCEMNLIWEECGN